ncbi:MAG: hypothetical protein NVS2B16_32690 [Chloroflexota bacterium]
MGLAQLAGKAAIMTGAAPGIGAAIAPHFDPEGAAVNRRDTRSKPGMWLPRSFGRLGHVQEFAAVATFLARDEARWITGQNIRVSGGTC